MRGKSRATDAPCRTIHERPMIATQCPQLMHGILFEKYGQNQQLNRQSGRYAREPRPGSRHGNRRTADRADRIPLSNIACIR